MRGTLIFLVGCGAAPSPVPTTAPTLPSPPAPPAPPPVVTVPARATAPAIQLAAAGDTTCALLADGSVHCWGDDQFNVVTAVARGALADHAILQPTRIAELPPATKLVLGVAHGCALLGDATVRCWGTDDGALGLGTPLPAGPPPSTPRPLPVVGLAGVEELAGRRHLCARVQDGTTSCWHDYDPGAGDPREAGSTQPVPVPGFARAAQLADGGTLSCARFETGKARCVRDVSPGRIPRGKVRLDPVDVPGLGAVTQLFAGHDGVCGLTQAKTVRCWGQTPLPHPDAASLKSPAYAVPGLDDVAALALGDDLGCALSTRGIVRCGSSGQPLVPVAHVPAVVEIVAGAAHACARTAAGAITCWGRNDQGQLGAGDRDAHAEPVTVGTNSRARQNPDGGLEP